MSIKTRLSFFILFTPAAFISTPASAVGNSIDKVYHPYVTPLETEVEWRAIIQQDDKEALDNQQVHRFGLGSSFYENVFTEIYIIGEKNATDDFDANNIELEALIQLTEQGEYSADWGLLIELERDFENNSGELFTGLLIEKEWGRLVSALNLYLGYEWRDDLPDETETRAAFQLRYRYKPKLEPAIEIYQNHETLAIGPAVTGDFRLGIAKKIHWEFGVMLGLIDTTPDQTIRTMIEYEF